MAAFLFVLRSTDPRWPAGRIVTLEDSGVALWSEGGALPGQRRLLDACQRRPRSRAAARARRRHRRSALRLSLPDRAVYADWLAERDARQGHLRSMVTEGGSAVESIDEQARWLWPLAVELAEARVEASFRRGRVHSLTVRDPRLRPVALANTLALGDAVRALRHLSWAQVPSVPSVDLEEKVEELLKELTAIGQPPSLEPLHLGLVSHWSARVPDPVLTALRATFPRWSTPAEQLLGTMHRPGEARLELLGPAPVLLGGDLSWPLVLREGSSFAFRERAGGAVSIRRGPPLLVRPTRRGWSSVPFFDIDAGHAFTCRHACLAGQDLFELGNTAVPSSCSRTLLASASRGHGRPATRRSPDGQTRAIVLEEVRRNGALQRMKSFDAHAP